MLSLADPAEAVGSGSQRCETSCSLSRFAGKQHRGHRLAACRLIEERQPRRVREPIAQRTPSGASAVSQRNAERTTAGSPI